MTASQAGRQAETLPETNKGFVEVLAVRLRTNIVCHIHIQVSLSCAARARPGKCWLQSALRAALDLRSADWTVFPDSFMRCARPACEEDGAARGVPCFTGGRKYCASKSCERYFLSL